MPIQQTLMALEVTAVHTRRLMSLSISLILGSFGTSLGSSMTLWFVHPLSCIFTLLAHVIHPGQPFTRGFPRADIHELLAPDLLHQLIKGTFKDHLVEWVAEYLHITHGEAMALEIIEDIDHRCAYSALS
jgi:hypothetical protein